MNFQSPIRTRVRSPYIPSQFDLCRRLGNHRFRRWWPALGFFFLTLCLSLLAQPVLAQVTIDAFPDKLVIQRHTDGDSGQPVDRGARFFTGTYDGGAPEAIEARIVRADDRIPLSPWQVVDGSPAAGQWGGSVTHIPAGGWYRLEVRESGVSAESAISTSRFGVGVVVLTLGQSNMARLFTEDAADGSPVLSQEAPHDLTWRLGYGEPPGYAYERPKFDDIPVTWGPVTGSGGIRLANRLQQNLGVPVLVLDFALDWTGIDAHWNEVDGPFVGWSRLVAALDEVDEVGAIVWAQGAHDAVNRPEITADAYRAGLDTLYARLQSALAAVGPTPFGIVALNRGDYTQNSQFDASFHAVRLAQRQWIEGRPQGFAAGSALDIDLSTRPAAGVGHFWATGYEILADRLAHSLTHVLTTPSSPVAGDTMDGGRLGQATLFGRHIRLDIHHHRGSRLRLADAEHDIEGFEVTQGAWGIDDLTIERAVLSSSAMGNHVVLTLTEVPTQPVRLRYLHGQNPNRSPDGVVARRRAGNWLYDDYAYHPERLGLPIQGSRDDLDVAVGPALNQPPNTADDYLAVGRGGRVIFAVTANDSDPEGELLHSSVVLLTAPSHGTATVDGASGAIDYRHDGSSSSDSFTYAVADSQGLMSQAATVHIQRLDDNFPEYPGRVLHLESDLGLESDQGGRTTTWYDQSGRGNHLRAAGDAFRLADALNGQDCIELDGQGDKLERILGLNDLPGGSADRTVFSVMRYRGEGFGGFAWGSTAEGMGCADFGNRTFGLIVDSDGDLTVQGWCTDFRSSTPGTGQGWLVQSAKVESNQLQHFSNGKLIDQRKHQFNTNADGILVLGAELDSTPHVEMDVAAVVIYDRALSESERMVVDSYLRQKYLGEVVLPPTSEDDSFEITLGDAAELAVLANDASMALPLDPSQITIVSPPRHGVLQLDPETGTLLYRHDGSIHFDDSFTYTVSDIAGQASEPAVVQLTLVPPAAELVTPGLVLHLESDHGVVTADDDEVVAWRDHSPLANHVDTSSHGPSWTQGSLGDHSYLSFDGSNDHLSRLGSLQGFPTGDADRSIFVLVRYRGEGFGGVTWGRPQCNGVFGPIVDQRGRLALQGWCFGFDQLSDVQGSGAGWRLHSAVHQQSHLRHYSDGLLLGEQARVLGTADDPILTLGREIDGFPYIAMDVAAVLVYDRALDHADRLRVEGYLQEKYLPSVPPGGDQPPTAEDDLVEAATLRDTVLHLLDNDTDDVALDVSSITLVEVPNHGFVTLDHDQGRATYRHDGSPATSDRFTYTVADSAGQVSEPATVYVTLGSPLPVTDGLVLRLEPNAGALVDDGDHHLEAWIDLSGHGNHVWASGRPRIDNVGPGGRPYLRLDGFDDRLENLEALRHVPVGAENRSLFAVVRYRSGGFGGVTYGTPACNQVFGAVVDAQGRLATQGWCQGNDFATDEVAAGEGWLSQTVLVDSGTLWQYRDADLVAQHPHTFETAEDGYLIIGAELDRSPHLDMDVAAVLLYDRALGEDERRDVETYLARRYRGVVPPVEPLVTVADFVHAPQGGSVPLDILGNDRGALVPSTLEIVVAPQQGTLSSADPQSGVVTYTHLPGTTSFVDHFTYRITDAEGEQSAETDVRLVIVPTIDGLVLHLDAAVGVVHQNGAVAGWLDLAEHANDLGAIGDPRLSSTRNGAPAVEFDGIDDRLQNLQSLLGLPAGDAARSVFLVTNYRGGGFGGVSWGSTSQGDCSTLGNRAFGTVVDFRGELAIQGWCFGNDFLSGASGTGAGWLVQSVIAGEGHFEHFRNGQTIDQGNHAFATDGGGTLMVGAELDGSPSVDMELATVLIFDRRLDDSERQNVETYLRARFIDD